MAKKFFMLFVGLSLAALSLQPFWVVAWMVAFSLLVLSLLVGMFRTLI